MGNGGRLLAQQELTDEAGSVRSQIGPGVRFTSDITEPGERLTCIFPGSAVQTPEMKAPRSAGRRCEFDFSKVFVYCRVSVPSKLPWIGPKP
jgi:hypothetical protein